MKHRKITYTDTQILWYSNSYEELSKNAKLLSEQIFQYKPF